ncbi:MAG: hypothetical protein ABJA87_02335 [bacterium]
MSGYGAAIMGWLLWLAAPIVATSLASVICWRRGRPAKPLSIEAAIAEHRLFLATLAEVHRPGADPHRPGADPHRPGAEVHRPGPRPRRLMPRG